MVPDRVRPFFCPAAQMLGKVVIIGMEPVIGVTCGHEVAAQERFYVNRPYVRSIEMAGGIPLLIPALEKRERLAYFLDQIDGLLLPGGYDVDPATFGEEPVPGLGPVDPIWDELELWVASNVLERRLPVLGICRGVQLLNVAAGGSLYQDIESQLLGKAIKHQQGAPRWQHSHEITVESGSHVERMLGTTQLRVNSFHHQAIKEVAPKFKVTAQAKDGVIEAIEGTELDFAVGVQWHPEVMWEQYPVFKGIFQEFVRAART